MKNHIAFFLKTNANRREKVENLLSFVFKKSEMHLATDTHGLLQMKCREERHSDAVSGRHRKMKTKNRQCSSIQFNTGEQATCAARLISCFAPFKLGHLRFRTACTRSFGPLPLSRSAWNAKQLNSDNRAFPLFLRAKHEESQELYSNYQKSRDVRPWCGNRKIESHRSRLAGADPIPHYRTEYKMQTQAVYPSRSFPLPWNGAWKTVTKLRSRLNAPEHSFPFMTGTLLATLAKILSGAVSGGSIANRTRANACTLRTTRATWTCSFFGQPYRLTCA